MVAQALDTIPTDERDGPLEGTNEALVVLETFDGSSSEVPSAGALLC
jgi:hypothetical protein